MRVTLALASGEVHENIQIEGTPQETPSATDKRRENEAEAVLDRHGVTTRLLVGDPSPRLGSLLRLGVEIQPTGRQRQRTPVAVLATMPDPASTLRALRRVRVELYRNVHIHSEEAREHLTLLHASGKSLRYPGQAQPPLRVLFTLPTVQLGSTVNQTWGEISMNTPYHSVTFLVRVILGFGAVAETAPEEMRDFVVEQKIDIRPKAWMERLEDEDMTEEEWAMEAYRRKGLDRVGGTGTYRVADEEGPPGFDEPGPSIPREVDLPTFQESEAASDSLDTASLGGELGRWVEVRSDHDRANRSMTATKHSRSPRLVSPLRLVHQAVWTRPTPTTMLMWRADWQRASVSAGRAVEWS
jgi:hypothetical protein